MRRHTIDYSIPTLILVFGFVCISNNSLADTEINLNDLLQPTSTPVPVVSNSAPVNSNSNKVVAPPTTPPPPEDLPETSSVTKTNEAGPASTVFPETAEVESAPVVVQGILKMKDIYEAGIKAYKEKDYDKAIRYLKKSLVTHDPYTKKYFYAEANAMLGIIYQFHIIHYSRAYHYYRAALRFEKRNPTARRHIRQVAKYRHRKD